eukprot:m.101463 g.101463  ORF g.101463 m.101463 type:complete len:301 (-) comp12513_c0_seq1:3239-4141(-)
MDTAHTREWPAPDIWRGPRRRVTPYFMQSTVLASLTPSCSNWSSMQDTRRRSTCHVTPPMMASTAPRTLGRRGKHTTSSGTRHTRVPRKPTLAFTKSLLQLSLELCVGLALQKLFVTLSVRVLRLSRCPKCLVLIPLLEFPRHPGVELGLPARDRRLRRRFFLLGWWWGWNLSRIDNPPSFWVKLVECEVIPLKLVPAIVTRPRNEDVSEDLSRTTARLREQAGSVVQGQPFEGTRVVAVHVHRNKPVGGFGGNQRDHLAHLDRRQPRDHGGVELRLVHLLSRRLCLLDDALKHLLLLFL